LNPINPYGQTKKLFELILKEYAKAGLIDCVAMRYFNVAGAYVTSDEAWGENHKPETHLIPLLLRSAQNKNNFVIYGDDYATPDGTCIRDYIHVYDLAYAHILAMEHKFRGSTIYNVGIGQGYSNKEVLQTVSSITGSKIPFKIGPKRVGDCGILVASPKKIIDELNFKPVKSDLTTIIKDAWDYYSATKIR
jgi:UDP-glucose 4-epimerase